MIRCGPPTSYRHWRGYSVDIPPTRPWPWPPLRDEAPGWIPLGYCAPPQGPWQTFRYHVLHGLLMGYPALSVLAFAWRERRSFEDSTVCDKPAPAGSPRRSASGLLGGGRGQRRETKPGKPAAATTGGADESATAQRHVGQPVRTPVT